MIFSSTGLIQQFLDFLGVQLQTADSYYIAFVTVGALGVVLVAFVLSFIFKLLVYIRKN